LPTRIRGVPSNLTVPPYRFASDTRLIIGVDPLA